MVLQRFDFAGRLEYPPDYKLKAPNKKFRGIFYCNGEDGSRTRKCLCDILLRVVGLEPTASRLAGGRSGSRFVGSNHFR